MITDQIESASSDVANPALSDAVANQALFEPTLPSPNIPMIETGKSESDPEAVQDDAWLDDWDLIIHRCSDCGRPFGTANRLTQHRSAWHSLDSPELPPYEHRRILPHIEKRNLCVLVENGDLFVKIPSSGWLSPPKVFQVNSQTLWAVSPVFRAMLGPESSFKEALEIRRAVIRGSNSPVPTITLDDPPEIAQLVLQILYHRHEHPSPLPMALPIRDLSKVAAFANKYELHDVLRPWARKWKWSRPAELPCEDAGYKVFISWVFGMEGEFAEASSAASISMFWSLEMGLYLRDKGPDGPVWEFTESWDRANSALPEETPEKIIKNLVDLRKRRINAIRNYIQTVQKERLNGSKVFCKRGRRHPLDIKRKHCDALQFGHFMQAMSKKRLLGDSVWMCSPWEINERIQKLKSLPNIPCTWVTEMKKVSLEAVEMDLRLQLTDFSCQPKR